MNSKVIGFSALTGLLLSIAVGGQIQPRIHLESGRTVRSWSDAELLEAKDPVRDVQPSAGGWLKLLLGLGAIAAAYASVSASYEAEEADLIAAQMREQKQQQYALAGEAMLRQQGIDADAKLTAHKAIAQVSAEYAAELELQQRLGGATPVPMSSSQAQPVQSDHPAIAAPASASPLSNVVMPKTEFITANHDIERNIPAEFAANPKTALIIGVPGAGKGMFVASSIRQLRKNRPGVKVFGIDPKNDPKETGYWSEGYDKVWRTDNERMSDEDFIRWLERRIEDFKNAEGEKLLVFDEITLSFRRWGSTDKKSFDAYTNFKISVASSGDSRGVYIWEIGQVAHAADLNVSGGLRGISKPFAVVSNQDRRATELLLGTKFVPLPENGKHEVFAMCDRSPVGRAIYDYMSDSWQPMPKLHNYSGYDRDTRTFIDGATTAKPDKPTAEKVIAEFRAGKPLSQIISKLWGVHPESEGWDKAKSECRKLLGLE